jgi:hypothetical protein
MAKKIFTEDLFPDKKDDDDIVELVYDRKKKMYVNLGLIAIYLALLIISLIII